MRWMTLAENPPSHHFTTLVSGPSQSRCDYSPSIRDQYLIYTDKVLDAFTESTCRQACTQEREFQCRSYSFLSEVRKI